LIFSDFNFSEKLSEGLDAMGFKKPSPIQEQAIPKILEGKDLIACAQTGTGKTAAFLLPVLNRIIETPESERYLNTLILAPTRELALQIDQQVEGLGYFTGVSSIPVYGGGDGMVFAQQKKAIEGGADIVIATPGRLIAMIQMGGVKFDKLKHLVLDEADRMLDMGFYEDIVKIISYLPANRQTLLFSATMPPKILTLAKRILNNPEQVSVAISKPAEGISQRIYFVVENEKVNLIKHILAENDLQSVIVFASTKESVKKLDIELRRQKLNCKAFHSDLEQKEREEILREFKSRTLQILIGTDILSRGIDVEGIGMVINFNAPHDAEDYIHRIGRTARAETKGIAITLISEKDKRKLSQIEAMIGKEIDRIALPEGYSKLDVNYRPEPRATGNNKGKPKFFKKKK
jgi:ATP-dependent RNA helicase RhlE